MLSSNTLIIFYSVSERIVFIGAFAIVIVGLIIGLPYGPAYPDVEILGMQENVLRYLANF